MIFNEKEMLEVCKKYGIDVVEKEGYPLYNGEEMNENFSMDYIMHDADNITIDEKTLYSKTLELGISVTFERNDLINLYVDNDVDKPYFIIVENDEYYRSLKPSMLSDQNISFAA